MRKTVAKKLRKLIRPENQAARRVYRRMKRAYSSLPHNKKAQFMGMLEQSFLKKD